MLHRLLYNRVKNWIPSHTRVLDLGTGEGSFLKELVEEKNIKGEGVEINPQLVSLCIQKGLVVHQGNIMDGLDMYGDQYFDFILLLGTFQELIEPKKILREIFRVGKNLIIAYNNFAYWKIRVQIFFLGKAPVTPSMPYPWYQSPNVQYFSIKDFHHFCEANSLKIVKEAYFSNNKEIKLWPNLLAEQSLALIIKNS